MTVALAGLLAAGAALALAMMAGRQAWLLATVLAYSAAVGWIIHRDMTLLMPALAIAIALGILGLGVAVQDSVSTQDVTNDHTAFKVNGGGGSPCSNIGQ